MVEISIVVLALFWCGFLFFFFEWHLGGFRQSLNLHCTDARRQKAILFLLESHVQGRVLVGLREFLLEKPDLELVDAVFWAVTTQSKSVIRRFGARIHNKLLDDLSALNSDGLIDARHPEMVFPFESVDSLKPTQRSVLYDRIADSLRRRILPIEWLGGLAEIDQKRVPETLWGLNPLSL